MIFCGRLNGNQLLKILGIFQLIGAIIITSLGIAVVVKFITVDHVGDNDTENADSYVNTHWTVTYAAPIWMGLIMVIAGAFGIFSDIKSQKPKYVYGSLFMNTLVVIAAIVLVVFSHEAITWFETCKYTYHKTTTYQLFVKDCSESDKSSGKSMFWGVFFVTLLMFPLTICMMALIIYLNRVLFEDGVGGSCFRSLVYKAKGNGNVNIKTKNTHEFDKVMNFQVHETDRSKPVDVKYSMT